MFGPEERLELIAGEIVQKVTPQKSPLATAVRLAGEALRAAFREGHNMCVRLPLALDDANEPELDVAIVVCRIVNLVDRLLEVHRDRRRCWSS